MLSSGVVSRLATGSEAVEGGGGSGRWSGRWSGVSGVSGSGEHGGVRVV